jgi:hypothetical protein
MALGHRKQCSLDAGRLFSQDQSRAAPGLCRREFGHSAQAGLEFIETGENQKRGIKGKQLNADSATPICYDCWESRRHLDAFAWIIILPQFC